MQEQAEAKLGHILSQVVDTRRHQRKDWAKVEEGEQV